MSHGRHHNFSAGPAVLPEKIVEELATQLPNLNGSGLGLMEISHRSAVFGEIVDSAKSRLRHVLSLPEDYHVLLLQGGASLQFCMVAQNLLQGGVADYLDTGAWSTKAFKEAQLFGMPREAWSGRENGYRRVPVDSDWEESEDSIYTHYTSNNTISGTQFHTPPKGKHLVCDMSSDIASRKINGGDFDLIYAGAQKNLGPSGVTIVAISPWAVERSNPKLPSMLKYRLHVEKESLFNTPNTLGIWVLNEVLGWVEHQGMETVAATNERQANKIYDLLDNSDFWAPHAKLESRSLMNVTWRLHDSCGPEMEKALASEAEQAGFSGIKGHRSVGGLRASIYNACPESSVDALVSFLKEFERARG